MAQVCRAPAAATLTFVRATVTSVCPGAPSCPEESSPQQRKVWLLVMAQVCPVPPVTARTFESTPLGDL